MQLHCGTLAHREMHLARNHNTLPAIPGKQTACMICLVEMRSQGCCNAVVKFTADFGHEDFLAILYFAKLHSNPLQYFALCCCFLVEQYVSIAEDCSGLLKLHRLCKKTDEACCVRSSEHLSNSTFILELQQMRGGECPVRPNPYPPPIAVGCTRRVGDCSQPAHVGSNRGLVSAAPGAQGAPPMRAEELAILAPLLWKFGFDTRHSGLRVKPRPEPSMIFK